MNPGVNIEDIKRYNQELKTYQDKAAQIKAGIDYNSKELARLCAELSAELGVTVTPENIAQIREERIAKIENTLRVGNEILNRIKSEEAQANSGVAPADQAPANQMPTFNTFGQAPQAPQAPQANIFNNVGGIPPIFGR